ncbi:MAG: hypothetical protein ABIJ20_02055 [Nanoarchaeota archaeon]|nr:hypothetical protein [Nanoarchaeota archaeon]MBU1445294.1 hypothetical protein [Nanoarchaeota archaeon]MBU2420490.1 hypothetical protein [Nanoarchaeota archaeon]MBU2475085.1 hypothetical protein [Nanoarchaeota archaeon]
MKKGVLLLILVLMVPLAQAFFPFTGFALTNIEEEAVYTCPADYEQTGEFTCIPKCIKEVNSVQLGAKKLYSYCFDSNVLYEPTCVGLKILYKKTICPDGCENGLCQPLDKCTDNTQAGSCSTDLKSYCNPEKQIITCKEDQICRSGQCTTSDDCSKNNGFTAKGRCPTGFEPILSTMIKKEAETQCCVPIEQALPTLTIDETATCEDQTPVGKCSETKPYLCTHNKILIRDCAKCGCPLNEKCNVDDPLVCEKIADITADFYDTIGVSDTEKPILYAPMNLNIFNLPKQMIPSYLFSPQSKDNTPTITYAHKTPEGDIQIDTGDSYFIIGRSSDGLLPKVNFYF